MLDTMIKAKITEDINMAVPLYLMMSYAYYQEDKPIATDDHKELISKDSLEAGTYLGVYPTIVKDTVQMVRKKFLGG